MPANNKLLILIFVFFVLLSGLDLAHDFAEGTDFGHVAQEAVILALSLLGLAWLLNDYRQQAEQIKQLRAELKHSARDTQPAQDYVLKARSSLAQVIARQFDDWHLTDSEKDIGWLLLKGLSTREIAALRKTHEKTVRQQASAIYRKADLAGRHAFAAWFIEDAL